jgi:hypothetical protein
MSHPTSSVGVWFAVVSSNLVQYRYNTKTLDFDVQFKGNPVCYRYSDVSLEIVHGFQDSGRKDSTYSKGEYFVNRIKNAHEFRKLTEEEAK